MSLNRWAGIFGILAAVLLVVAVIMASDTPEGDDADEQWIAYIEDNDTMLLARTYVFIAAGLSVLVLYSFGLQSKLGGPDPIDTALQRLGAGATLLGVASLGLAGLIGAAVAGASKFGDIAVDPSLARTFDNWLYGALLVGAAIPMGVLMAVVAIQTRRRNAFPQWVLWASVLGVIGMATSLIFLPIILLPLWLIAISVSLFRAPATA